MTSKNFGLAGVSPDVQFGKAGPRLLSNTTIFEFKNATATALARVQAAEPFASSDLTTKQFVENAISNVQTELNSTQTGAGLGSSGTYTANGASNYIGSAVSLANADNILDYSISLVQSELNATQTGAGLGSNGSFSANSSANYLASATSLFNATNLLDYNLNLVQNEISGTQTGAGLQSDGTYSANSSANYLTSATSLFDADNLLDYNVKLVQDELNTVETAVGLSSSGTLPSWSGVNYVGSTSSVIAAVAALDAQIKSNSDAISAIGSAFNYVGTLDGGASSGAAFDLSTLPADGKDVGDYYKVSTSGWFKGSVAGQPFYANLNDGIVKNAVANSWDVIDNTDSTVAGTTNRVLVTGSADAGYTVDISPNYDGQTSITSVGTIATGTWQGNTVTAGFGGTGIASYTAGDILYASGTSTLSKLAKGTGLQILRMNSGASAPEYATLVASMVGFSASGFSSTDANAALIELKGFRDSTNTGAGLLSNGSYAANALSNYITGATSLVDADNRLDYAIKTLENSLSSVTSAEIYSPSLKTSVKATNAQVELYGDISSTKTLVGLTTFGASTNSRYEFDLSTADTIILRANSATAADVSIVLDPKGSGTISASSSVIENVSDPVSLQDAMTLGFADSNYIRQQIFDISEANTNTSLASINGTVTRVIVMITSAWDGGSSLTIGIAADHDILVTSLDIDITEVANFVVDTFQSVNAAVSAYISGTGSGTAKVIVEYIAA